MSQSIQGDPHSKRQSKKAAASGWIGSALEYYDFFIYATAAALLFPQLFFPSDNPTVGIIISLASFGVGYIARPLGAVVLGHMGDRHGRKTVLVYCMFMMGASTMCIGLLPTYAQIGIWAPALLILLRLIQGFAVAGEVSCASSMTLEHAPDGRRGYFASFTLQGVQAGQLLAAAVFLPLAQFMPADQFASWGWRIPFLLSAVVLVIGWIIRRQVHEAPVFTEAQTQTEPRKLPVIEVLTQSWGDLLRVICMALSAVLAIVASVFGATYAVQPAYGIGFPSGLFMWIPVLGNICAVILIPFVGKLSDKIGRKPPVIVGVLCGGILSFGYLYAISIHNMWLSLVLSLLMWGVAYQGFNGVFPSLFPELFRTRVRVTGMAIGQNIGVACTAFLPALFVSVAPPGSDNIPLKIGALTFGICVISAIAAITTRETFRIRLKDLGDPDAVPMSEEEYEQVREKSDPKLNATASNQAFKKAAPVMRS
ncbi:Predicted arabinose efflux permease, MFS family [Pseudomonas sp. NFACC15-1]|uniref:MFS transporter n=1 Tax=unclassified Pseudomonas TaxID=196821 RepID=UPI00088D6003|nr:MULTISPECIES: MFS transporter [unclassified Pseudomonas]SDA63721.1 Predicted arabinose efflux permease, MFS family [Pseudomonas sp. NFACC15-1]SDB59460.1 Predicted arabinose efflux permease, MFS family [Pseudomonas sp. NFACC13-1]SDX90853.1 Predicted arabinose efflux permease, MFS family [Pseudomonas sp. NFACC14]